jgi:hypothetical protein
VVVLSYWLAIPILLSVPFWWWAVPADDAYNVVTLLPWPTAPEGQGLLVNNILIDSWPRALLVPPLMAAAVADYRPADPRTEKRSKDGEPWRLELEPTDDVLRTLGEQSANGRVLVGFAAETGDGGLDRARAKRTGKNADLVVYNDVARSDVGFEAGENEVVLISAAGERTVSKAPKSRIAAEIWDEIERLLEENGGRAAD